MALATIRNLGLCPCPRCTIRLDRVHNLGMRTDRKHRVTKARIDNETLHKNVAKARHAIYVENRPVDATVVEDLLKEESYIPTRVSLFPKT